jgi:hypothetical protein
MVTDVAVLLTKFTVPTTPGVDGSAAFTTAGKAKSNDSKETNNAENRFIDGAYDGQFNHIPLEHYLKYIS